MNVKRMAYRLCSVLAILATAIVTTASYVWFHQPTMPEKLRRF